MPQGQKQNRSSTVTSSIKILKLVTLKKKKKSLKKKDTLLVGEKSIHLEKYEKELQITCKPTIVLVFIFLDSCCLRNECRVARNPHSGVVKSRQFCLCHYYQNLETNL